MHMLSELINGLGYRVVNFKDFDVKKLVCHSGKVSENDIFIAIKGYKTDGHRFVNDAITKGVGAVVVEKALDADVTQIITDDTRKAMAEIAVRFYKDITDQISLIGITGTNGKTTTAYLIRSVINGAGLGCGLIGSVEYDVGSGVQKSHHTTPEIVEILEMIKMMVKKGLRFAVIEVTSHGLKLKRVAGLSFPIRVFTNLSRDHLDFHREFNDYRKTKISFFTGLDSSTIAIVNEDDPFSKDIMDVTRARVITYGLDHGTIRAQEIKVGNDGLFFDIRSNGIYKVRMRLLGRHNVYNGVAAFITTREIGIDPDVILKGLYELESIPGRLMLVENSQGLKIYTDFAHTPDALRQLITSVRGFAKGRIIVVFGCGGDRDQGKRSEMGKVVEDLADYAIVTSDNPRSEDPLKIIDDIKTGIEGDEYIVEPDRRKAIEIGIKMIGQKDVLLIAGKGHEEYQIIRNKRLPFNDAKVVREILGCMD